MGGRASVKNTDHRTTNIALPPGGPDQSFFTRIPAGMRAPTAPHPGQLKNWGRGHSYTAVANPRKLQHKLTRKRKRAVQGGGGGRKEKGQRNTVRPKRRS